MVVAYPSFTASQLCLSRNVRILRVVFLRSSCLISRAADRLCTSTRSVSPLLMSRHRQEIGLRPLLEHYSRTGFPVRCICFLLRTCLDTVRCSMKTSRQVSLKLSGFREESEFPSRSRLYSGEANIVRNSHIFEVRVCNALC